MPETIYYSFVLLGFFYVLSKVGTNKLGLFVVFIFWAGLFSYLGDTIFNIYKIIMVLYALYLFFGKILIRYTRHEKYVNIIFILFSVSFWISYSLSGGNIITILSQYGFKYGLVFLIYHGIKDILVNQGKRQYLKEVLLQILYIQVFLSIAKILIFGFDYETNVGSMVYGAGGLAVVIPIDALFFYWLIREGKITSKEWIIICSFFIIAIASGKRAPVILFPFFILLLVGFSKGSIRLFTILKYVPFFLVLLYVGVKLTPTLSPDNKLFGSFSIPYIVDYSLRYNFGTSDPDLIFSEDYESAGRGGSIVLLAQPKKLGLSGFKEVMFGKGLYETATKARGRFLGGKAYGIEHIGSVGENNKVLYALGYSGLIFMVIFSVLILSTIRNRTFRTIILIFYLWEFLIYGNQVIFSNHSAVFIVFISFYSNTIYNNTFERQKRVTSYNSNMIPVRIGRL